MSTCKKHGTYYGTCACCMKERRQRNDESYKQGLRDRISQLELLLEQCVAYMIHHPKCDKWEGWGWQAQLHPDKKCTCGYEEIAKQALPEEGKNAN